MGASCFWNIDRQGHRHTALSRKSPGPGCLCPKEVHQCRCNVPHNSALHADTSQHDPLGHAVKASERGRSASSTPVGPPKGRGEHQAALKDKPYMEVMDVANEGFLISAGTGWVQGRP
jgi:hypothetical protein